MNKINKRLGLTKLNKYGDMMEIIEYNNAKDIIVEFQDKYKGRVHTRWNDFNVGNTKNPYSISVFDVGITGNKYKTTKNGKKIKEYDTWYDILRRSYSKIIKNKNCTYQTVTCCDEWLLYDNFYEWLSNQENFNNWLNGNRWAVDKDILVKGNKIYSPDTCVLVPSYVNSLFTRSNAGRGSLPIGVSYNKNLKKYRAKISKKHNNSKQEEHLGYYNTPEEAFLVYKSHKESYIKQVANEEYNKGNITKRCYDAMMNYKVEITD